MKDENVAFTEVWTVHCYWDKPYIIENQRNLLGVFSSRNKAEEEARLHREFAASDKWHKELECTCEIESVTVDVGCHITAG